MPEKKTACIIGAGPAGLTAAYELLANTHITPTIVEKSDAIGGLARTVRYKGNRMDIGGHRFFSKSDRVVRWWLSMMPLEERDDTRIDTAYQGKRNSIAFAPGISTGNDDDVMLVRPRKSRIYYRGKLFDYPLTITAETLGRLGLGTVGRIFFGYLGARLFPRNPEKNLEDFFINRFGKNLYEMFFKSYTEKVWGVPCTQLGAEWGKQRIKGLSVHAAMMHALRRMVGIHEKGKGVETSLIEQFLYPKLGPGQLWERVAKKITERGCEIALGADCTRIIHDGTSITAIEITCAKTGEKKRVEADYFFSTMPIKELIGIMDEPVPSKVRMIAGGLSYRDFITIGMLVKKMRVAGEKSDSPLSDNWLYIQDPGVRVGRIQIFNNWSPALVADQQTTWIGLEYFSSRRDGFWEKSDDELLCIAQDELRALGMIETGDVLDAHVVRVQDAYPAYTGAYAQFYEVRKFLDSFENLFLVGRNGMHKYNNQDHSMLTAMAAVENIINGRKDKENIWEINTEQDYHESDNRQS
ncbi:NAD(P)/FAD-dependent oxidoreductase [Candidatus Uhrbacteria bacterium]|nr:NAD(P)/FAD-dependent oxidoreductase [Candidatus Uhrbacteria bacterium]